MKQLFMSGYPADVISHHGVLDEGVSFIHKPFSMKDLAFKVRAVLEERGIHPQAEPRSAGYAESSSN
jgi:DNA-binding response OmpR family regulator